MRFDPHRGVYVGAPRTDAEILRDGQADDAATFRETTVSGAGGFLVGVIVGVMGGMVLAGAVGGPRKYD